MNELVRDRSAFNTTETCEVRSSKVDVRGRIYEIKINRHGHVIGHARAIHGRSAAVVGKRQTSDEERADSDGQGSEGTDRNGKDGQGTFETCAILQPTSRPV